MQDCETIETTLHHCVGLSPPLCLCELEVQFNGVEQTGESLLCCWFHTDFSVEALPVGLSTYVGINMCYGM